MSEEGRAEGETTALAVTLAVLLAAGLLAVVLAVSLWAGGPVGLLVAAGAAIALMLMLFGYVGWMLMRLCARQVQLTAEVRRLIAQRSTPPQESAGLAFPSPPAPTPALSAADTGGVTAQLEHVLAELEQLRSEVLLSDDQRALKRQRIQQQLADDLAGRADQAIADDDFEQARALLAELQDRVPDEPRAGQLRERLNQAADQVRQRELAEVRTHVGDQMAVGDFEAAIGEARRLLARFPDEPEAADLLEHVQRERDTFVTEQRKRLYREVQRLAQQRRWDDALTQGRRLIELHPATTEAQAVAAQLATIEENSRIAQARELRNQMLDLLDRNRLAEAVSVGEEIIEKYPDTQAAADLRGQIDRLRQRARDAREA
jgi:TolA-binding protein